MKRKIILKSVTAAVMAAVLLCLQIPICADDYEDRQDYHDGFTYEEWNSFILGRGFYYVDDGYDVQFTEDAVFNMNHMAWILNYRKDIGGYEIEFSSNYKSDLKVKVPDSYKSETYPNEPTYVKYIEGSCAFKEFDLNPENKYMTLVDNVVFSKDKKTLMSYAQNDERTVYEIPNGTEIIKQTAFSDSDNIVELFIPDSVKELQASAFSGMDSLEKVNIPSQIEELPYYVFGDDYNLNEVYIPENSKLKKISEGAFLDSKISELTLPSFEVEICDCAFGYEKKAAEKVTLKSYVKPQAKATYSSKTDTYKLKWNKVANATSYEVYQKLSNGSYKLLKKTTGTSINLNSVKAGKKYTFAVKPIANVKAYEDIVSEYLNLPESYTIEGTMSDDVTFTVRAA